MASPGDSPQPLARPQYPSRAWPRLQSAATAQGIALVGLARPERGHTPHACTCHPPPSAAEARSANGCIEVFGGSNGLHQRARWFVHRTRPSETHAVARGALHISLQHHPPSARRSCTALQVSACTRSLARRVATRAPAARARRRSTAPSAPRRRAAVRVGPCSSRRVAVRRRSTRARLAPKASVRVDWCSSWPPSWTGSSCHATSLASTSTTRWSPARRVPCTRGAYAGSSMSVACGIDVPCCAIHGRRPQHRPAARPWRVPARPMTGQPMCACS